MADSILRLKVESQEYDAKLKRAAEGLQKYTDGCRKAGGTLEFVEQETLEFVRALGNMETTSKSAKGSLSEMTKAFTDLTVQYNKLTDAEKQSPYGKAMAESLSTLNGRIQDSKKEIDDINKSLNGGGGLSGALDAVAGKFGLNIEQLTKFGGAAGLATTALKVAKDAFFQSESNIDEWGRTVEGAKNAYNTFLDTLNNGNWSNFFQNLQTAIQGGRDLYDVFDRLGSIKSNNAAAIAIVQQQIAQLRLAKQQGENVDAQLKAATQRLANLQKQSIQAGKTAGTQSAFQTIRSGVNSVGGVGVNDATINYAIQRIMQNGQSEFDKYRYNRDTLREKGMVTRTQTINDSQGGTYERQYREFDINALTKEQQKQYALAQAITEGETRIQQGIATYAQAVQEGTSSAREQFKGNRYALQGSTGGGGINTIQEEKDDFEEIIGLIPNAEERVKSLKEQIRTSWDEGEISNLTEDLKAAEAELQRLQNIGKEAKENFTTGLSGFNAQTMRAWMQGRQGDLLKAEYGSADYKSIMGNIADMNTIKTIFEESMKAGIDAAQIDISSLWEKVFDGENIPDSTWQELVDTINEKLKEMNIDPIKLNFDTGSLQVANKDAKESQKNFSAAAAAISQAGSAMQSIEDPSVKIMGMIGQAIASIALGFATASSKEGKGGIWYWIAATAAGLATMISTISSIHSATGFANGGMIQGNSYSGDNLMAQGPDGGLVGLNAGEIVLSKSMQNNLANTLQGNGMSNINLRASLQGEQILLAVDRTLKRQGKGELATFK